MKNNILMVIQVTITYYPPPVFWNKKQKTHTIMEVSYLEIPLSGIQNHQRATLYDYITLMVNNILL